MKSTRKQSVRAKRNVKRNATLKLNDRQLAHVLASLRYVQSQCNRFPHFAEWFGTMPHFDDTSAKRPLTSRDVDNLCMRLNTVWTA
jgi:hypothetical protein